MADFVAAGSWKPEPSYKTDQWSLPSSGTVLCYHCQGDFAELCYTLVPMNDL